MNRGFAAVVAVVCAAGVLAPVGATALPTKAAGGSTQAGLKQSDLTVPGGAVGDNLGDSVAVSGNTVVAGAYDRTVGTHSKQGAVYVFARPTTGWRSVTPTATLTAGDGQAGDLFGYSVAISGRTIVVGSVAHAVGSTLYQGTVYVFTEPTTGWKTTSHPTAELTVSDGVSGDELGSAVAISGDTIVAGAPREGPSFNGEAYLFTKPASGWKTKTQTARLTISAGSNPDDFFGGEVAVSGNTVVVSDYGRYNRAGRAYLYLKPASGPWIDTAETSILNGSDTANYEFGAGIAVAGDTVVVGESATTIAGHTKAGSVFVFVKPASGWGVTPAPTAVLTASDAAANDMLGSTVAISGTEITSGAAGKSVGGEPGHGAVYVFHRPDSVWANTTESTELLASDGAANDELGDSLGQGSTFIAAGARDHTSNTGAVYVFAPPGPLLSKHKESHKRWKLGTKPAKVNPAHTLAGGTTFSFSLSQASTVSLAFTEKVGKHTVKKGTLKASARLGVNTVFFDGKIGHGKKLAAGHCTVTISATNANGSSTDKHLKFVALARKKH